MASTRRVHLPENMDLDHPFLNKESYTYEDLAKLEDIMVILDA